MLLVFFVDACDGYRLTVVVLAGGPVVGVLPVLLTGARTFPLLAWLLATASCLFVWSKALEHRAC